jgi:hypothetical protein
MPRPDRFVTPPRAALFDLPSERSRCHLVYVDGPSKAGRFQPSEVSGAPRVALGRALVLAMVTLLACDVVGGFIAVASGVDTWDHAWGFDTESTVPLPVGVVQLALAWLAARDVRPPVSLIAAVVLSLFCLTSVLFGSLDGDLRGNIDSAGWFSWGVVWGFVLLLVTGLVGLLAAAQARQLYLRR